MCPFRGDRTRGLTPFVRARRLQSRVARELGSISVAGSTIQVYLYPLLRKGHSLSGVLAKKTDLRFVSFLQPLLFASRYGVKTRCCQ